MVKYLNVTYLTGDKDTDLSGIKKLLVSDYIDFEEIPGGKINYLSTRYERIENKLYITIKNNHPSLSTFNYRIRDAVTGLTFQPMGTSNFVKDTEFWIQPNATPNDHNGILLEITDSSGNLIESHDHEAYGRIKENWGQATSPWLRKAYKRQGSRLTQTKTQT